MIGFKTGAKTCRATLRFCSRRADGDALTEREENDRAAHLAACFACKQKDAALSAQSELLRAMATVSQSPPLAEGAIAARAVSAWRAEQARAHPLGLPARFDKRFAFGLAALVAMAGAGTAARLATNAPPETAQFTRVQSTPQPAIKGSLPPLDSATSHAAKTTARPPGIADVSPRPRNQQIAPARLVSTVRRPRTIAPVWGLSQVERGRGAPVHFTRAVSPVKIATVPATNAEAHGDDMVYLNGAPSRSTDFAGRWLNLTPDAAQNLQAEIEKTIRTGDVFVDVPFPRIASTNGYDATTASAIASYRQEREIVDARLQRKITLGKKRVSFSDLCAHLQTQSGISFAANKSVADDKITVFCTDRPLRDVMREITALFNFTWQRSGEEGAYQYRLTQPLRAQLVEEELRNHDRNEALIALDKEMEKYKALANLSPDEAKERALSATTEDEKKMYKNLAGAGWGAVQMYAGLSQDQLAALRDGQTLDFSAGGEGSGALPQSTSAGILQSLGNTMRMMPGGGLQIGDNFAPAPGAVPPASVPGAMASARLALVADELGQFSLIGSSGFLVRQKDGATSGMSGTDLATGRSPSSQPKNETANADLKNKPEWQKTAAFPTRDKETKKPSEKLTTADLLEAIHKATGQDVIGDYYTRLYDPDMLTATPPRPLFDLLCHASDKARLRWGSEENWLTFRSASFFNDRPKEVPNRLLERWASARETNQNALPPESLLEIAQLSDGQLSAASMAEGAKVLYGLEEWDVARNHTLRESWRLVASLSKNQQKAVLRGTVLRFDQLAPAQQERFAAQVLSKSDLASAALGQVSGPDTPSPAEKLAGATLQVDYQAPKMPAPKETKDGARTAPTVSFTYRYGTENAPFTKTLKPNSTSVSSGAPKSK